MHSPPKWCVVLPLAVCGAQHSPFQAYVRSPDLQFFIGASITGVFNMCGTDLHPQNPATAQESSNIVRCALSVSGLAVIQLMITRIGAGWTFTVFAGMCFLTVPMMLVEVRWGLHWRCARMDEMGTR